MNNTKTCKYCNTEIDKSEKVCPNCKKKQGLPIWSVPLIIIVVLLIFGAIGSTETEVNTASIETNALATSASVNTSTKTNTIPSPSVDTSTKTSITPSPSIDTSAKASTTPSPSIDASIEASTSTNQSNIVSDQKSYTVYITKTGKKYHSSGCRYLSRSCISISSSDAISEGYDPCSVCNP